MTIKILGIDIAKQVFQRHGVNDRGRKILKKRISQDHLLSFLDS